MKPLRDPTEGYDEFVLATVAMRAELTKIREMVIGRHGQLLPRIGGFDMSVWICMLVATRYYDG